MKIHSKLYMKAAELTQNGPITIVAFGDSVTHGALSNGEFDYDCVYWNRLRTKINEIRCYVPINVINAGIGGATAKSSLKRMERQVFAHAPDLIILCFGLNDINTVPRAQDRYDLHDAEYAQYICRRRHRSPIP